MDAPTAPDRFAPLAKTIDDALLELFGFQAFRQGQREVIESIAGGKDTLVVMPTGAGKSLCYMLPACVMPGLAIVVSPLIALMKDQADALDEFGIPATFINSSLSYDEQRARLFGLRTGQYKILLVAPERFKSAAFMRAIEDLPVGLFAIDEAHCISSWGHDFRPDYLDLDKVRRALGTPPTLALTATATPQVQRDMIRQLDLEQPRVVVSGFERPNLFFEVYQARSKLDKFNRLEAALNTVDKGSCLIYCATRKQVEELGQKLKQAGHHPALYHAGLPDHLRDEIQDAFMAGDAPLLIATNAFGMGVDKSDVRLIIHNNIPGSVEAYYQEAGRAGRDGEPAHCLLLFQRNDRRIHEFFIDNSYPTRQFVERVWSYLQRYGQGPQELDSERIADQMTSGRERAHPWAVESALRLLERGGHISFGLRNGTSWLEILDQARTRDLRIDFQELEKNRTIEERHLDQISRYATARRCRQSFLVRYFSESADKTSRCGHCDICCGPPKYGTTTREKIVVDEDPQILLKKLLSGVARCRGRFGAHIIAGMLRGSRSKRILQSGLDKLSTYALLSELRQQDLILLLELLNQLELTAHNEFGALTLTDAGSELMRSQEALPSHIAQALSEVLLSSDELPPDGLRPTMRRRAPAGGTGELNATYFRTLELVKKGLSYQEIARQRGLTSASVLRHFMVLADRGYSLNLTAHQDQDFLPKLREVATHWTLGDPLAPLKEQLSDSYTYDALKLHLAIVLEERKSR